MEANSFDMMIMAGKGFESRGIVRVSKLTDVLFRVIRVFRG